MYFHISSGRIITKKVLQLDNVPKSIVFFSFSRLSIDLSPFLPCSSDHLSTHFPKGIKWPASRPAFGGTLRALAPSAYLPRHSHFNHRPVTRFVSHNGLDPLILLVIIILILTFLPLVPPFFSSGPEDATLPVGPAAKRRALSHRLQNNRPGRICLVSSMSKNLES